MRGENPSAGGLKNSELAELAELEFTNSKKTERAFGAHRICECWNFHHSRTGYGSRLHEANACGTPQAGNEGNCERKPATLLESPRGALELAVELERGSEHAPAPLYRRSR